MAAQPPIPPPDNRALEQYRILMQYLQYENTMYWGRANFFLVASAALVAFFPRSVPHAGEKPQIIAGFIVSIAGLMLAALWWASLHLGEHWIGHWHHLLVQIEPGAFGDIHVLREWEGGPSRPWRSRHITRGTVLVFIAIWLVAAVYSTCLLGHS